MDLVYRISGIRISPERNYEQENIVLWEGTNLEECNQRAREFSTRRTGRTTRMFFRMLGLETKFLREYYKSKLEEYKVPVVFHTREMARNAYLAFKNIVHRTPDVSSIKMLSQDRLLRISLTKEITFEFMSEEELRHKDAQTYSHYCHPYAFFDHTVTENSPLKYNNH